MSQNAYFDTKLDDTRTDTGTDTERSSASHGSLESEPSSSSELERHLPDLIEELRRLRVEMEKCSRVYDLFTSEDDPLGLQQRNGARAFGAEVDQQRTSVFTPLTDSDRFSTYDRESSYARGSAHLARTLETELQMVPSDEADSIAPFPPPLISRQSSRRAQQLQKLPRPSVRVPLVVRNVDYTVMWVSGECGISLRTFATNKTGAQVAVLQQADGVTTGIANCRLGDHLVTVNDEYVGEMRFKEIVQKLKTTRRPITLGFRTNPNIHTSPTASSGLAHPTYRESESQGRRSFYPDEEVSNRTTRGMSDPDRVSLMDYAMVDRKTNGSVSSSASTVLEEMEVWCREQEDLHKHIIVLLTETVTRCESIQQEYLDHVLNLLKLAPNPREVHPRLPAAASLKFMENADEDYGMERSNDPTSISACTA